MVPGDRGHASSAAVAPSIRCTPGTEHYVGTPTEFKRWRSVLGLWRNDTIQETACGLWKCNLSEEGIP